MFSESLRRPLAEGWDSLAREACDGWRIRDGALALLGDDRIEVRLEVCRREDLAVLGPRRRKVSPPEAENADPNLLLLAPSVPPTWRCRS